MNEKIKTACLPGPSSEDVDSHKFVRAKVQMHARAAITAACPAYGYLLLGQEVIDGTNGAI